MNPTPWRTLRRPRRCGNDATSGMPWAPRVSFSPCRAPCCRARSHAGTPHPAHLQRTKPSPSPVPQRAVAPQQTHRSDSTVAPQHGEVRGSARCDCLPQSTFPALCATISPASKMPAPSRPGGPARSSVISPSSSSAKSPTSRPWRHEEALTDVNPRPARCAPRPALCARVNFP